MGDVVGLYQRFGIKLPGLGDGWVTVRCFTGRHQDRHASARVHLRSGGFRCFACNTGGGVLDALEHLGVRDRDEARRLAIDYGILEEAARRTYRRPALPSIHNKPAPEPVTDTKPDQTIDYDRLQAAPTPTLERTWVYTDEHNQPVGRVHRIDLPDGTKRIFQERPTPDGWAAGLDGTQLPLYQLPQVLEHAGRGARVLVVEGEKACDALGRLGFFATTNPGGAGKWRPEHTRALRGATALPIMDCDLPGRSHAIQISLELLAAGTTVFGPLDPNPYRNDGWDIVDHLAETADTVRAVTPTLTQPDIRNRLHDHLQRLLATQPTSSATLLQHKLEHSRYIDRPGGRAHLDCPTCGNQRVHDISHGLAYCPCGAHQIAP